MKPKIMITCCIGLLLLSSIVSVSSYADVPQLINYQGKLIEDGAPVAGSRTMTFSIWDNNIGVDPESGLWHETQNVAVTDGIYSVEIGFASALPANLYNYDDLFLQVDIQHPTAGWQRLSPLMPFDSTVFAIKAARADSVAGGAVTSVMISNRAVSTEKVADNAVTTAKIADGTVKAIDIEDGSGSGLDADKLDGLEASAFITGVNAGTGLTGGGSSGDVTLGVQIPFNLTGVSSGGVITAINNSLSTGYGGYFEAKGSESRAVYGYSSNTGDVENYGGYFKAYGKKGIGVYGYATGSEGIGVYDKSKSAAGVIVENTDFDTIGILGAGFGVYGKHMSSGSEGFLGYDKVGVFGVSGPGGYAGAFKGKVKIISTTTGQIVLELRDDGRAVCKVLEITGGSDLSEGFEIRGIKEKLLPSPGMVVNIDPDNPGDLMVSNKAYDRRVAGIISGAGGVKPGMLMGQKDSMADGTNPLDLTGRVYCWVDTSGGSIEPGDLLTTSSTPGHAMKVWDYNRAQGAILGKAMTSLKDHRGLVLVLVYLQ